MRAINRWVIFPLKFTLIEHLYFFHNLAKIDLVRQYIYSMSQAFTITHILVSFSINSRRVFCPVHKICILDFVRIKYVQVCSCVLTFQDKGLRLSAHHSTPHGFGDTCFRLHFDVLQ